MHCASRAALAVLSRVLVQRTGVRTAGTRHKCSTFAHLPSALPVIQATNPCTFCDADYSGVDEPANASYVCTHVDCTSRFHGSCFATHAYFDNDCHFLAEGDEAQQTTAFKKGLCCAHTQTRNKELEEYVPAAGAIKYVHAEFLNEVGARVPAGSAGAPGALGAGTKPLLVAPLADGRRCILVGSTSPKVTTHEVRIAFVSTWLMRLTVRAHNDGTKRAATNCCDRPPSMRSFSMPSNATKSSVRRTSSTLPRCRP